MSEIIAWSLLIDRSKFVDYRKGEKDEMVAELFGFTADKWIDWGYDLQKRSEEMFLPYLEANADIAQSKMHNLRMELFNPIWELFEEIVGTFIAVQIYGQGGRPAIVNAVYSYIDHLHCKKMIPIWRRREKESWMKLPERCRDYSREIKRDDEVFQRSLFQDSGRRADSSSKGQ